MQETNVDPQLMRNLILGVREPFKPCAFFQPEMVSIVVALKDCSYSSQWINEWSEVHWENNRPWYKPWKNCVGFSVYCEEFHFLSGTPVVDILNSVWLMDRRAFGKYEKLFYRLAKDINLS
jgi:hypothetical protein